MNQLNPAFSRYLVMQHGIKLEELQDSTLRFCCSLFHATLQKLIVSGADRLREYFCPLYGILLSLLSPLWNFSYRFGLLDALQRGVLLSRSRRLSLPHPVVRLGGVRGQVHPEEAAERGRRLRYQRRRG